MFSDVFVSKEQRFVKIHLQLSFRTPAIQKVAISMREAVSGIVSYHGPPLSSNKNLKLDGKSLHLAPCRFMIVPFSRVLAQR